MAEVYRYLCGYLGMSEEDKAFFRQLVIPEEDRFKYMYRKQRECRFGHRLREGGRISEIAPPRRGYEYAATDQESVDASSRQDRTSYQVQHRMG